MEPSVVYSQAQAFDEQDGFLYFVLGLISVSRHLAARLEAEAAQAVQPDRPESVRPDQDAGEVAHILS